MIRFSAFLIALFSVIHPIIIRAADGGTGGTETPLLAASRGGGRASSRPMTGAGIEALRASPVQAPGLQRMGVASTVLPPEPKASSYYPEGRYVQCFCKKCDNSFLLYFCYCGRILYLLPTASVCFADAVCLGSILSPVICCLSKDTPCEIISFTATDVCWDFVCCGAYLCQENVIWPRDLCCFAIDAPNTDTRCPCCCVDEKCCYEGCSTH